ncbi:xylulokinase [soil metagenome]
MPALNTCNDGPLLIGIDVGSSNIKAVVYELDGRSVAHGSVPTITHYPQPTWAYVEPEQLWESVCSILQQVVSQVSEPNRIVSVAVASFGEAGIPLDRSGSPTYDEIAWFDRRTIPQAEWLEANIGEPSIFAITGLNIQPIYTLSKLMWIRENQPEAWQQTTSWLLTADYIAFKLCGAKATDYSLASRSLAFNLATRTWATDLLAEVGIDPQILSPLVQSGTPIGRVTPAASQLTGLPEHVIVGAGGHDHVCGALAAGVVNTDQMLDSMGTAEALFFPRNQPITDLSVGHQGYSQGAHVAPDKYYLFGGLYTSGASLDWIRDIAGNVSHEQLIEEAGETPPGSLGVAFLPHLRLSNAPTPDAKARGAFLGLTTDVTRGAMVRAVLEGLGYEARATIEPVLRFSGMPAKPEVSVIGGSTKNGLLLEIKSSILGTPLRIVELDEATALGAAMLGGIACGAYRNFDDALATVSQVQHDINPQPEHIEPYDRYFKDVYLRLFSTLQPINHSIHDIMVDQAGSHI